MSTVDSGRSDAGPTATAHGQDNLASPPLYTEAAHVGSARSPFSEAPDTAQAPSYQASAQDGDMSVLGGLPSQPADHRRAAAGTSSIQPDNFFDIAPSSDATSFQVGYLGLEGFQAWVKGDVLLKLSSATERERSSFYKCIIELRAVESADADITGAHSGVQGDMPTEVELFYSSQTLWDATAATSSTAPPSELPKTMPFSFPLTHDLPHCVHLPRSRLAYTLRATLHSGDLATVRSLVKVIPVHLTRYSAPGALVEPVQPAPQISTGVASFGSRPHMWRSSSPSDIYVELERTLFRRSEPMNIRILIPPLSDRRLMTEKGLHLRAVEADLVRIITMLASGGPSTPADEPTGKAKEKGKLAEASRSVPAAPRSRPALDDADGERVPSYAASMAGQAEPEVQSDDAHAGPSHQASNRNSTGPHDEDGLAGASSSSARLPNEYETLLAHSGKLCRFSTHRAVNLRLTLHPPFSAPNMPHPHPDHDAFAVAARSASMYVRPGGLRDRGPAGATTSTSRADDDAEDQPGGSRPTAVETAAPGSLAAGSGCESITQETLMHKVRFEVRVRIALDGGPAGRQDVRFSREVCILPGAAGEAIDERPRDSEIGVQGNPDSRQQSRSETSPAKTQAQEKRAEQAVAGPSNSDKEAQVDVFANFNEVEEYDGYEDVLQDVETDDLPPAADDVGETSYGTLASIPYLAAGPSSTGHSSDPTEHPQAVARSAESEDAEPPPTLQQSQHDLQLEEVEVEGVGFAVPRRRELAPGGHPTLYNDLTAPILPPSDSDTGSYQFRPAHGGLGNQSPPPPPPSPPPPVALAQVPSDFPPPPPTLCPARPDEGDDGSRTGEHGERARQQTHEPPPYLDDAEPDQPPSFDAPSGEPSAHGAAGAATSHFAAPASAGAVPAGTGPRGSQSPVSGAGHASLRGEDNLQALPPAYAQPPPSVPTRTSSSAFGPPSYSVR